MWMSASRPSRPSLYAMTCSSSVAENLRLRFSWRLRSDDADGGRQLRTGTQLSVLVALWGRGARLLHLLPLHLDNLNCTAQLRPTHLNSSTKSRMEAISHMPRISSSSAAISSSLRAGSKQVEGSSWLHSPMHAALPHALTLTARNLCCVHCTPAGRQHRFSLGSCLMECCPTLPAGCKPNPGPHVCSRRMSLGLGSRETALGLGLAGAGASLPARLAGPRDAGAGACSTGPELRRPRRGSGSRSSLMSASSAAAAGKWCSWHSWGELCCKTTGRVVCSEQVHLAHVVLIISKHAQQPAATEKSSRLNLAQPSCSPTSIELGPRTLMRELRRAPGGVGSLRRLARLRQGGVTQAG